MLTSSQIEHLNDISTSAAAMESKVDPAVEGDSKRLKEVLGMPVVIGTDKRRASSSSGLAGTVSRTGSLDEKRDTFSSSAEAKDEKKFNHGNGAREWVTDVVSPFTASSPVRAFAADSRRLQVECWFSGAHCGEFPLAVNEITAHSKSSVRRWRWRRTQRDPPPARTHPPRESATVAFVRCADRTFPSDG